jgi:predicted HicB family RNase H-like nuclease
MREKVTNILEYKGYIGDIEIDTEEDILFGHVKNLKNENDIVSYEGETIKELRADFQAAVDSYINSFVDVELKEN